MRKTILGEWKCDRQDLESLEIRVPRLACINEQTKGWNGWLGELNILDEAKDIENTRRIIAIPSSEQFLKIN